MRKANIIKKNIDYVYLMISQGSNYIFPLFIYPIIIYRLGLNSFGYFSLGVVILQFLILIIDYGFGYTAAPIVNKNKDNIFMKSQYYFSVILSKIILFLICMVILLIYSLFAGSEMMKILFLIFVGCLFSIFNPLWFFQATAQFKFSAILSIISKALVIIFIVNINSQNVYIYFLVFISQFLFIALIGNYIVFKNQISIFKFNGIIKTTREILQDGKHYFLSILLTSLSTLVTPIILGTVAGKSEIGLFNSVNSIKQGIAGFASPIIQVLYAKQIINNSYMTLDIREYLKNVVRILFGLMMTAGIITIPLILFSNKISLYLFNEVNTQYLNAIRLTLIVPLIIIFNSVLSSLFMVATGNSKSLLKISILSAIIALVPAYHISLIYGAIGIIVLLLCVEIVVALSLVIFIYNLIGKQNK